MVVATKEPFCNPTCRVDNGGCADDEICVEGAVSCSNPDVPCKNTIMCTPVETPTMPGEVESANKFA